MNIQKRSFTSPVKLETRAGNPGSVGTLTGYIAVFNSDSVDMGYTERIRPGAFRDTLAKNDVVALVNHDYGKVVGRLSSGTLRLAEDERGLSFSLDVPDTTTGQELRTLVGRGDLTGCSFGFYIDKETWTNERGRDVCYLERVSLVEVSVGVTFPAYPATSMDLADSRARLRARLRLIAG